MNARRGRKTKIGGQFAPRLIEMLEAPAYRVLSLSARRVLDRLEIEIGHHGGNDNGKLPVTFDHFHEFGIHRHAIAPAIRETVALGFVEITQEGRSGNGEFRRPNLYRLTYRPTDKIEATDEWKGIETLERAEAVADAARKNKRPVPVSASFQCRKPHHKPKLPVPETVTTRTSAETITTSISREHSESEQAGARPIKQAGASGLPHDGNPLEALEPLGGFTDALMRSRMVQNMRVASRRKGGGE